MAEILELHGDFLNALMRLAGRRMSTHIPATVADDLERALDDIPDCDIPADYDLNAYQFFAGERKVLVENIIKIFRMYGGCEVESFIKPPLDVWLRLIFEDINHG